MNEKIAKWMNRQMKFAQTEQMPQLIWTPQEEKIFKTLLDINREYNLGITYRLAGGIVRDRILGKISDDLDFALDAGFTGSKLEPYCLAWAKKHPESGIKQGY